MTPSEMYAIDKKVDDGVSNYQGKVLNTTSFVGSCQSGEDYDLATTDEDCGYSMVLN